MVVASIGSIIKPQLQVRIPFETDMHPDTIVYSNIIAESSACRTRLTNLDHGRITTRSI